MAEVLIMQSYKYFITSVNHLPSHLSCRPPVFLALHAIYLEIGAKGSLSDTVNFESIFLPWLFKASGHPAIFNPHE